ncbi:hypothetical protein JCM10450v2_001495 [Rhodotorula kratochvilovae]
MAAFIALLALASAALATPAPALPARDFSPVVRALHALAPVADAQLLRRQSATAAINGLEDLLEKAVTGQSGGGKCASECSDWVDSVYDCSDAGSYTQVGVCACGSDETREMQTCGRCYGSSDEEGANAFADYCASALDAVSSAASRTASSSATGTAAGASSRGISGFSPASSVSSAIGGGILSDIASATNTGAQGAATGSSNPIEGGNSGTGSVRAGAALVAAAAGGVLAVFAL